MKLIIQIPCFNEEKTLTETINDLPRKIAGFDSVELLVIDDGSTDKTFDKAKQLGVDHIIQLGSNRGLATAFKIGIEYALDQGADVIVNTDGDNQYSGKDIAKLTKPIIEKKADMVISVSETKKCSFTSNKLNKNKSLKNFYKKKFRSKNRQLLPKTFAIDGTIYIGSWNIFYHGKDWLKQKTFAMIMPSNRSVDIDNIYDFEIAKLMYKMSGKK